MTLSLVIIACSPETRRKILTTFFDGVPSEKVEVGEVSDTIKSIDSTTIVLASSPKVVKESVFYHNPFGNKECGSCHDQERGGFVEDQPELCYQCHESRTGNNIFRHGPTGAGLCTSCHHPHKSKADNLLYEEGESLCAICHLTEDITNNKIHKAIRDEKNCIDCHDPHSSDLKFMMKKGACLNCHDQVKKEPFLHAPVASDYCSMCHDSHESEKEYLLLAEGQELCMKCHEVSNVFNDELHKREENMNCTTCHNPHGGAEKFMLSK